jgi:hypothetical protein
MAWASQSRPSMRNLIPLGLVLGFALFNASDARACGCFTPPDPTVPIVQAGERIAFAMENGVVTAHIQIQYQGDAKDFGWLLPLPSVPTFALGTDELFTQLTGQTQPKYKLQRVYEGNCSFDPSRSFQGPTSAGNDSGGGGAGGGGGGGSPLVLEGSIGPYGYAVLHADNKDEMLKWLSDNHYFVPAGTDDVVGPYIRPGAYFLALKLLSGNSVGNLQPVVLTYQSDLPMIPLVLTSVAANPHMGIQVWMLGNGRAIPRNYYHTVVNDAKLNWLNGAQNYNDVIIAATAEAPDKHSFVTEYAGGSSIMQRLLYYPGRFGSQSELAAQPTDVAFVQYVLSTGYPLTSQTLGVLQEYIPVPPLLNVPAPQFYQSIYYYLGSYRQQHPEEFVGWTENFQPVEMAAKLQERVVTPTIAASALFDKYPSLTRLYTTLSPEDMNKDPVFSYNPGLRDYSNVHNGILTYHCGWFGDRGQANTSATLKTEAGWVIDYPNGTGVVTNGTFTPPGGPSSQYIQILREQGNPEVLVDNTSAISNALGGSGCGVTVGGRASRQAAGLAGLVCVAALLLFRRRRAG